MTTGLTRWMVTAINAVNNKEYQRVFCADSEPKAILMMVSAFPVITQPNWIVTATSWGYQAN